MKQGKIRDGKQLCWSKRRIKLATYCSCGCEASSTHLVIIGYSKTCGNLDCVGAMIVSGKRSNWACWRLVDVGGHDVVVVDVVFGLRNGQIVC